MDQKHGDDNNDKDEDDHDNDDDDYNDDDDDDYNDDTPMTIMTMRRMTLTRTTTAMMLTPSYDNE